MRLSKIAIALGLVVMMVLFAFPYFSRFVAVPVGLVSLRKAEAQMVFMARVLRDYRSEHQGRFPESFEELTRYVTTHPDYDPNVHGRIRGGGFQYCPTPRIGEPLVSRYLSYRGGKSVLLWLDRNGRTHMSRVWLWPNYVYQDP